MTSYRDNFVPPRQWLVHECDETYAPPGPSVLIARHPADPFILSPEFDSRYLAPARAVLSNLAGELVRQEDTVLIFNALFCQVIDASAPYR